VNEKDSSLVEPPDESWPLDCSIVKLLRKPSKSEPGFLSHRNQKIINVLWTGDVA
jgi:hypothetical protein